MYRQSSANELIVAIIVIFAVIVAGLVWTADKALLNSIGLGLGRTFLFAFLVVAVGALAIGAQRIWSLERVTLTIGWFLGCGWILSWLYQSQYEAQLDGTYQDMFQTEPWFYDNNIGLYLFVATLLCVIFSFLFKDFW